jgi:uncharacterized glyoxalase superfamily protein PhnB
MSNTQFIAAQLVLPIRNMPEACAWYTRALDFEVVFLNTDDDDPDGNYAILRRDTAELHLILDELAPGEAREHPWTTAGTGYLFLIVRGVEDVYAQVQARGAPLTRPMQTEAWGARAFQLKDPSGNLILVAESVS